MIYKNIILALLTILFCLPTTIPVSAQDYSKMNLHLIYIAHETETPVNELCEKMRVLRNDAEEIDDALIVYLSDGKKSPMSFTNLKDITGNKYDTEEAFKEIVDALQDATYHEVDAVADRRNLLNILDVYNFADEYGRLRFNSVVIDFYVGPNFWTLGYNEKVIAHLYVALNAAAYSPSQFSFNVWVPRGQEMKYPEGKPFGEKNVDGINSKLKVLPY